MGVGDAAVYMSQNSKFWRYAMDHPYLVGAGIGVAGGACFVGGVAIINYGSAWFYTTIAGYGMSDHAVDQMIARRISSTSIQNAINNGIRFNYYHEGVWKQGFYNISSRILVATYRGNITTVINKVGMRDILRLVGK